MSNRDEPWFEPVEGPEWYLKLDEISIRSLAEGICLARVQRQAFNLIHFLDSAETPKNLYAVIDCGEKQKRKGAA